MALACGSETGGSPGAGGATPGAGGSGVGGMGTPAGGGSPNAGGSSANGGSDSGRAPALTIATVPEAFLNQPYSTTLSATGGTGELTWSVVEGDLPAGLMLSASGSITGTATSAGSYTFTVRVTDAAGQHAEQVLTLVVRGARQLLIASNHEHLDAAEERISFYTVNLNEQPLTLTPAFTGWPAHAEVVDAGLSPNGQVFSYLLDVETDGVYQLALTPRAASTSPTPNLLSAPATVTRYMWSPDSAAILYGDREGNAAIVELNGAEAAERFELPANVHPLGWSDADTFAMWIPATGEIQVARRTTPGVFSITTLSSPTGSPQQLAGRAVWAMGVGDDPDSSLFVDLQTETVVPHTGTGLPSPDGEYYATYGDRIQVFETSSLLEGEPLIDEPGIPSSISWSADAKHLYWSIGEEVRVATFSDPATVVTVAGLPAGEKRISNTRDEGEFLVRAWGGHALVGVTATGVGPVRAISHPYTGTYPLVPHREWFSPDGTKLVGVVDTFTHETVWRTLSFDLSANEIMPVRDLDFGLPISFSWLSDSKHVIYRMTRWLEERPGETLGLIDMTNPNAEERPIVPLACGTQRCTAAAAVLLNE